MEDRPQRYPSDTSDEQWALIEPLLPPVRTGGRPEKHPRRAIVDAILYVVRTGCAWRQLPADFPPMYLDAGQPLGNALPGCHDRTSFAMSAKVVKNESSLALARRDQRAYGP
jgi:hypothetical protein